MSYGTRLWIVWRRILPLSPAICVDMAIVVNPKAAGYLPCALFQTGNSGSQVAVMKHFGYAAFDVCGRDRGGRVAHRLALDHGKAVRRLAVLDIVPTYKIYTEADRRIAEDYYHWFFLIQPFDYPERMISHDVAYYLGNKMGKYSFGDQVFTEAAMEEYFRCFSDPATIQASCEDYRAAATIDITHDDADQGRKLHMPVLTLWAKRGVIETCFDALALWRQRAERVEGEALDTTHYMAEEVPGDVATRMSDFFARNPIHAKATA